jgi:hypothetical protein
MNRLATILPLAAALAASAQQPTSPGGPAAADQKSLTTVLNESAPPPSPASPPAALATVSLEAVSLSGSLSVENGLAFIGNNGAITASDKTVRINLTRGGNLNICASTKIHLSSDNTISGGGLMIALDRGALEGHYLPGAYSDVLLTPDLRILISGPGQADFSLRVNNQGDTCIDNRGDHAPYILASSLLEGGAYRVQPNQRVLFEHGSLQQVVDNEKELCGCPAPQPIPTPTTIVSIGAPGTTLRSESQPTPPKPSPKSTSEQNPFPVAQSEGLEPPPPPPTTPVVPAGQAHAQITVPLVYDGETSRNIGMPASSLSNPAPTPTSPTPACNDPLFPGVVCDSPSQAQPPAANPPATPAAESPKPKKKSSGFVRFLHKIFGPG